MAFKVIRNDITKMQVDAIVNTANPKPIYASGTDGAIYKAAGAEQLLAERKKIGNIARGEAAVTPAFDLDAKYIIHTVGPVWKDGNHGEFDTLRSCYRKSLAKAWELKCKSVAFPLIATGVYGFPKAEALDIALSELQKFSMKHKSMDTYLVVFGNKAYELSQNTFGAIEEYIDSHYVKGAEEEEYSAGDLYGSGRNRNLQGRKGEAELEPEEKLYREMKSNRIQEIDSDFPPMPCYVPDGMKLVEPGSISMDDLMKIEIPEEKTFQEKLFEYIDKSGLKGPDIYKSVEISKQMYSTIQMNKDYHPQKNTAILFCLVLKLDIDQTRDLLSRAGYVLNSTSLSDVIVTACITNGMYVLGDIDMVMVNRHLPTLRKYGMTKEEAKKLEESTAKKPKTKKKTTVK